MRIVVIGAGGLGSYLGALLDRAGHEVALVARGAHAAAIRGDGLRVDSFEGDFVARPAVVDSGVAAGRAALAILAVKAFSLDEIAGDVAHLASGGAYVVSVLNGVDVSERLRSLGVPGARLVDGIAYMTAFRIGPGRVERRAQHQRLVVGSYTGAGQEATDRIAEAFRGTGVEIEVAEDIRAELWRKMAVVCSLSVVCALSGRSMGPIRSHPFGAGLQRRAIAEVLDVGRAAGVDLPTEVDAEVGRLLDAFPSDFHPSVIHDLHSGRRTEMEELGGVVVRLGRSLGVDVPLHEAATLAVQLQEG